MGEPFNDSPSFIEDRNRGSYHERMKKSRWGGSLPRPKFVYGVYAPLDGAIPPFAGFGEVANYAGDNPAPHQVEDGTPKRSAPPALSPDNRPGRYTASSAGSSEYRHDDGRHYESPVYREDVLRHRAMTSRNRYPDEPHWSDGRYDKRPRYTPQDDRTDDRAQFHEFSLHAEDRVRAQEAKSARQTGGGQRAPPQRTRESPDLRVLTRGADGHPQSAWAVGQNSGDPPEDDVICPPPDPEYVGLEELRLSRVRTPRERRDGLPPSLRSRTTRQLGAWFSCQIQTLDQAYNLCALVAEGQQESYDFFCLIVHNLASFPREFRTEGEGHLMRYQQDMERAFWTAATGGPRVSRSGNTPTTSTSRGFTIPRANIAGPAAAAARAAAAFPFSFGSINTPTAHSGALNAGIRMPAIVTRDGRAQTPTFSPDPSPGYLGSAPADPLDVPPKRDANDMPELAQTPNTLWTVGELLYTYVNRHPDTWGVGIRGFLLTPATHLGDTPSLADVLCYHTSTALCPGDRRRIAHQYHLFFDMVVRLFSIRGLFAQIVMIGGYPFASLPMSHYPYLTDNITLALVAAWFVQHGIAPGSDAVTMLESWAKVRRNIGAHVTELDNEEWAEAPGSAAFMESLSREDVPLWADLHHAPLRPTAPSSVIAAGGLDTSIHAPMEGVATTTPPSTTNDNTEESPA
ncbi:hypothetical protein B0H15DRAFT_801693 [Mycena belliarum]|uniref:Uncharacterized protein n=1 Tax=Mycena belliarum TaxID=1033014 RepID=A0AAD6U1U7_9AGAR|nr:hypothetical protein B0H15DRAFT_801693 [Mycena belliae]